MRTVSKLVQFIWWVLCVAVVGLLLVSLCQMVFVNIIGIGIAIKTVFLRITSFIVPLSIIIGVPVGITVLEMIPKKIKKSLRSVNDGKFKDST